MLKYHVWAGHDYYPGAGLDDYRGSFATVEEAIDVAKRYIDKKSRKDWATVVETTGDGSLHEINAYYRREVNFYFGSEGY
jgi:hypothetical protein